MPNVTTFGKMPNKMPKGFFKAVSFPVLAMLDKTTGDNRRLLSEGARTRDLPLSIRFQPNDQMGHDGAVVSGALFEVTIDPLTGKMSGQGFLLADENGRTHARYIATGAMRGNSVDLAEVKARFVEDLDNGDYWVEFYDYALAATTGVSKPAFAEAHAVLLDQMSDDELVASLGDPMAPLVCEFEDTSFMVLGIDDQQTEITASAATMVAFDDFYHPEADEPTKVIVTADGSVYGHLALWESCHDGFADRCMRVPRPTDGYASFNKAGVLTDRGQIETGPIFAFGGHRPSKSAATIEDAYGGIENAWADVRVSEGRFGPWISGRVRPGVSDEVVYAVRASRLSGHWVNGRLKAIVSVNAEGFDVPGSGLSMNGGTSFAMDGETMELVASFPGCVDAAKQPTPTPTTTITINGDDAPQMMQAISTYYAQNGNVLTITPTTTGASSTFTLTTLPNAAQDLAAKTAETEMEPCDGGDELRRWADEKLAELLLDDDIED